MLNKTYCIVEKLSKLPVKHTVNKQGG